MSMNSKIKFDSTKGLSRTQVTEILERRDMMEWRWLASHADTPKEALYYMTEHGDADVREIIAANPNAPYQAHLVLIEDPHAEVRAELAMKIGRLAPQLVPGQRTRIREQVLVILQALAQDEAPKVRRLIVDAIKDNPHIPHDVTRRLAEDHDISVCGPILEYSPLLSDVDLKEIIAASHMPGVLPAIARRGSLSGDVSDVLMRTRDIVAVSALLANSNAQIREDTLDALMQDAPGVPAWHEPLAMRANLSVRLMTRIATFVASHIVDRMLVTHIVNADDAKEILDVVRLRLKQSERPQGEPSRLEQLAQRAIENRLFNDSWVTEMMTTRDSGMVTYAIGLAAGATIATTRKVFAGRSGKAIMAMCWKAGLSARTGYEVQKTLAQVPAEDLSTPKGGIDYPMKRDEMQAIMDTLYA
jgi:Uncharacterised protein conserved in bacteria (DUF2336)